MSERGPKHGGGMGGYLEGNIPMGNDSIEAVSDNNLAGINE